MLLLLARLIVACLIILLFVKIIVPWIIVRLSPDPVLEHQKRMIREKRQVLIQLRDAADQADDISDLKAKENEMRNKVTKAISDESPNANDPEEGPNSK